MEQINTALSKIKTQTTHLIAPFLPPAYVRGSVRPKHDWVALLVTTATIFCLAAGLAAYLYFKINNETLFVTLQADNNPAVSIDSNLLQKVLSDINNREAKFNTLRDNPTVAPDPSR